jgi:hypothetical protein
MSNFNGRVDLKSINTSKLFNMTDKIPANQCTTFRNPTEGLWDNTMLSQLFFSKENILTIQNGIRAGVYNKSNQQYLIGYQDGDALKIVMRSIFLQYSSNQNANVKQQIIELNTLVLNYCIAQVYGEAQGYIKYLNDVSTLAVPIAHPVMSNNSDKVLEFKSWF